MLKSILIIFLTTLSVYADSLEVRVDPKEPLVNENYRVIFEIKTEEGTDPIINFSPLNAEVVAKGETGVRTRTTYVNGRLSTERTLTVAYELVSNRARSAYLRNINVDLNGKTLKHSTVRINILKTPKRARDVIVRAEVDKEEAFVGESILVRYYLYNKLPVSSSEVRKFPKLDNFLKRYHQEKARAERVRLNGEIYSRRVVYTAQLFAQKNGEYEIDPIYLSVRYSAGGGNNPFDTFGFGSRYGRSKTANISSQPVKIKIKALPLANVPPSFSGLVGEHSFNLELNKSRFVVNEPIELKLKVSGTGALELYEAPRIFNNNSIEEFETSSDLIVKEDFSADKTFLYTYLGRDETEIKNKKIPFSYFDPNTLKYVTKEVTIGDILIAGGVPPGKSPAPKAATETLNAPGPSKGAYLEPIYKLGSTYSYNALYIAIALAGLLFIYTLFVNRKVLLSFKSARPGLIKTLAKEGLNYSSLHRLVERIGRGPSLESAIKGSDLSNGAKEFLLSVIDRLESEYKEKGSVKNAKVPKKYLREFANKIGANE